MRPRGHGSVHQRPDGSWCGQIDLGSIDGKRRRKTIYGRTKRIVETELAALRRQLDDAGDLPTSDLTVEKWLKDWLDNIAKKRVRPNTWRSYRTAVNEWLIPSPIGKKKLGVGRNGLAAKHIREMHDYIMDELGLSSTTAHNAHRVLSIALNAAVKDGKATRNVAALEDPPPKETSRRHGLTADEAVKVLRAAVDDRLVSRWLAAFLLGWRQGELLGLQWDRVDTDEGLLDLSWALQRVSYSHGCVKPRQDPTCGRKPRSCPNRTVAVPRGMEWRPVDGNLILMRPKTGKARMIACPEPLRLALILRRHAVEAERAGYKVDHDLVWCQTNGRPIDPRDDWQAWSDLLKAAKLGRHVTLHEARHTTATLLLEANVDPKIIMELLGHSEIVTLQGYQHVSVALQRPALGALADKLAIN